ncbi:MAG: AbrB/MazE/SpoVT family DNA-binding domain-containing protein [Halobacteriaceae archaeon]
MDRDDIRTTRKAQQFGSSTIAVSLPAAWVRRLGVEKGDELHLSFDAQGDTLRVSPASVEATHPSVDVDVTGLSAATVRHLLRAQYVLGRRRVRVHADGGLTPAHREGLVDTERLLMGFTVVTEGDDAVDVRCSVDAGDFEVPALLGRLADQEATLRADVADAAVGDGSPPGDSRPSGARRLFYLLSRVVHVGLGSPGRPGSVGAQTAAHLLGYHAVADHLATAVDRLDGVVQACEDGDRPPVDEAALDRVRTLAATVDRAATASHTAVLDPSVEGVVEAWATVEAAAERFAADHAAVASALPPAAACVRRLLAALRDRLGAAHHALDVASRFAFASPRA